MSNWILPVIWAGLAAYSIWRLIAFIRLRKHDGRIFVLFWLWLPVWWGAANLLQPWLIDGSSFRMTGWAIAGLSLLDFFYFFIIVAPGKVKQQYLVLIAGAAATAIAFGWLSFGRKWTLYAPHQGTAIVWTDGAFGPQRYYFMQPDSPAARPEKLYEDVNYGKAVFAPADGITVGSRADGFLEMDVTDGDDRLRIAIGPLVSGSVRFQPGDAIVANQPLGLLDAAPGVKPFIPGLQVEVPDGVTIRFKDVRAGRFLMFNRASAKLGRNTRVESIAKNRFRVR